LLEAVQPSYQPPDKKRGKSLQTFYCRDFEGYRTMRQAGIESDPADSFLPAAITAGNNGNAKALTDQWKF
jgi:hypothetical protein